MDEGRARQLLQAERAQLEELIRESSGAAAADRVAVDEPDGFSDGAEPLTAEATDDTIAASFQDRLAAIERAEERLDAGTYGLSVRSGLPIPDERLEADPAAELTVEEANN